MTDKNVEVDVPSGSHIRNVQNGLSFAFWCRLAGAGVLTVAVIFLVLLKSGSPVVSYNSLVSSTIFFIMFLGPSAGLTLLLTPWIAKAVGHPTRSAVPRVLVVGLLAVLALFISLYVIVMNLSFS